MSNDKKFQDFVEKAEEELRLLHSKEDVIAFMDKISVFYDATSLAFGNELQEFLLDRKINNFLSQINNITVNRIKRFKGYEMDYKNGKVVLTSLDGSKKAMNLSSILNFLENGLLFSKEEFGFFLIVSFLSQKDNYEMVQLFLALK